MFYENLKILNIYKDENSQSYSNFSFSKPSKKETRPLQNRKTPTTAFFSIPWDEYLKSLFHLLNKESETSNTSKPIRNACSTIL